MNPDKDQGLEWMVARDGSGHAYGLTQVKTLDGLFPICAYLGLSAVQELCSTT